MPIDQIIFVFFEAGKMFLLRATNTHSEENRKSSWGPCT